MPNWVKVHVEAPSHVMSALLDERGYVNFSRIIPFKGPCKWDGVYGGLASDAEKLYRSILPQGHTYDDPSLFLAGYIQAMASVLGVEVQSFPPAYQVPAAPTYADIIVEAVEDTLESIMDMVGDRSPSQVQQLFGMVINLHHSGFTDSMSFARKEWGTKWNAGETTVLSDTLVSFQTAWTCPVPVLYKLSQLFPDDIIKVQYADEDLGNNCGLFELKNGEAVVGYADRVTPPPPGVSSWRQFAMDFWGYSESDFDEED